jgi:AcrR family transcriptional regulator
MKHPDTKQRLLSAAKSLFAREGYQATSMRAITGSAGVNLALANYHFGSKEALLEAIFEQHLKPLNEVRLNRLKVIKDEAEGRRQKPTVFDILSAFIEPTPQLKEGGEGGTDFSILIGRAFIEPDETAQKIFLRLMKPVSKLMLDLFGNALPELPKEAIFWRFQFVIGALTRAMFMYKNRRFESMKLTSKTKMDSLMDSLLSFTQAGMEAPMRQKQFTRESDNMKRVK